MDRHLSDRLISHYLDGLVSDPEKDSVQRHVEQCPECARRLAQFTLLDQTLAEMESPSVSDAVFRQVGTRILREATRQDRIGGTAPFSWWLGLLSSKGVACAGLLFLIGCALFFALYSMEKNRGEEPSIRLSDSAASTAQEEFYRKASGFLSVTAKKALTSVSEESKNFREGPQAILSGKLANLSEGSSLFLSNAKARASQLSKVVEGQGSLVLNTVTKQATAQIGFAAGMTLLQLLGTSV